VQWRRVHTNRAIVLGGDYAVTSIRQWGLKTALSPRREGKAAVV